MQEINIKFYLKNIAYPFIIFIVSIILIFLLFELKKFLMLNSTPSLVFKMGTITLHIILIVLMMVACGCFIYLCFMPNPLRLNSETVKAYNTICTSGWRQDLLNFGFTEIIGELDISELCSPFTLKGFYENFPIQIRGINNNNSDIIVISIPLLLKTDDNFFEYWSAFVKQYPSQNINLSSEKLSKTIPIIEAIDDKIVWSAINQLINITQTQEYNSKKLINYIDRT
jgi:hypothetical protein